MSRPRLVTVLVLLLVGGLLGGAVLHRRGPVAGRGAGSSTADPVPGTVRSEEARPVFSAAAAVPVEGARVRQDTLVVWIEARGRAEARRRAVVRSRATGTVVETPVREGDRLAEGQLLALLDSTSYALEVRRRRAAHREALAEFRSRMLGTEGTGLTGQERAVRRRQARVRSGLVRATVELEQARHELAKTRVRAPIAGRVASLAVTRGASLSSGDSVAIVLDLSRVEVDVDVLEERVPHLEPGRRARVRFTALPEDTFPGRVATINPLVDEASSTVRVTVRLDDPGARVLPGMHATVALAGRRHPDRLLVPRASVVERRRRDVVFVFVPSDSSDAVGRARWVYVRTGRESDRFVEVGPGQEGGAVPAPGEVVLVGGHATLTHDAPVRLTGVDRPGGED